ncbi:MAG: integrase core domain-containing protein [Planctomycetota bacterium]
MSRIGDCWDNAVMESFFGTYKQELQHHAKWENLAEARAATMEYIEIFYNRKRLHSTLGYRTPREVDEAAK